MCYIIISEAYLQEPSVVFSRQEATKNHWKLCVEVHDKFTRHATQLERKMEEPVWMCKSISWERIFNATDAGWSQGAEAFAPVLRHTSIYAKCSLTGNHPHSCAVFPRTDTLGAYVFVVKGGASSRESA